MVNKTHLVPGIPALIKSQVIIFEPTCAYAWWALMRHFLSVRLLLDQKLSRQNSYLKYMMYHESLQANLFMGASAPLPQTSCMC